MSLEEEVSKARVEIQSDSISMSVTELCSLFQEGTLEIRPEFQRLFRWNREQKSRLIESVLLGIPLPSIFVSQGLDGRWELVDGLQRVSTLLQLQDLIPTPSTEGGHLKLMATRYLPSLEGKSWVGDGDGDSALTDAQKLDIRFARLDVKIIKRGSDVKAKFDLFQRLNSFGSSLTNQEIRSALVAGVSSEALAWLVKLAATVEFQEAVTLPERMLDEQYDLELLLRFLMLHAWPVKGLHGGLSDFSAKLDDWSIALAEGFPGDSIALAQVFTEAFSLLRTQGGENLFRKWDASKGRFVGNFSRTSYEVLALGLGFHIANGTPHRTDLASIARDLWQHPSIPARFATGLATGDRFAVTIPLGRELLAA